MDEGHDADDDADKACEQRQDHEGTRGVQVGCVGRRGGVKGQRSRVGFRLKCRSRQVSDMRRVSIQAIKLSPKTGRASTLNTIPYISKNDKSIVSTLVFFLWRNATDKRLLILITTVNTSKDVAHGRGAQRSLPIVSLCVKHFPGIQ